jgi:fatty-acyl-CoA synthase
MNDALAGRAGRNTIGDLLTRSSERYRDKTALRWGETAWSYRALDHAACQAGAGVASGLPFSTT